MQGRWAQAWAGPMGCGGAPECQPRARSRTHTLACNWAGRTSRRSSSCRNRVTSCTRTTGESPLWIARNDLRERANAMEARPVRGVARAWRGPAAAAGAWGRAARLGTGVCHLAALILHHQRAPAGICNKSTFFRGSFMSRGSLARRRRGLLGAAACLGLRPDRPVWPLAGKNTCPEATLAVCLLLPHERSTTRPQPPPPVRRRWIVDPYGTVRCHVGEGRRVAPSGARATGRCPIALVGLAFYITTCAGNPDPRRPTRPVGRVSCGGGGSRGGSRRMAGARRRRRFLRR